MNVLVAHGVWGTHIRLAYDNPLAKTIAYALATFALCRMVAQADANFCKTLMCRLRSGQWIATT